MPNRRMTESLTPAPPLSEIRAKYLVKDFFRLKKGAAALALPEPVTVEAMRARLPVLHEAICAMQSLDDLGSKGANQQADADGLELQRRYRVLEQCIKLAGKE